MSNPYFKNSHEGTNNTEWEMFSSATAEIVNIYGRSFQYLPKTLVKSDNIFGEDTLKAFNSSKPITMLIENYEGYSGNGDVFSRFGLTIDDRLTLQVQQNSFDVTVGMSPQIGDLIYYPISKQLFEVNYVRLDDSFYQFVDANMSYKIECTLLKYSHETLNTGITEVDSVADETDSNTTDELTDLTNEADQIIDFEDTFFKQR